MLSRNKALVEARDASTYFTIAIISWLCADLPCQVCDYLNAIILDHSHLKAADRLSLLCSTKQRISVALSKIFSSHTHFTPTI